MALAAKATYMAAKVHSLQQRIQPVIDTYHRVVQMGVNLIQAIQAKIAFIQGKIAELTSQVVGFISKQQQRLMDQLNKLKARIMARLSKMIAKVTAVKEKAIAKVEELINSAVVGLTGINLTVDIVAPDPILGTGGSITPTVTPDLFDDVTTVVDDTITSPDTVVTSSLVVTGSAGGDPFVQASGVGTSTNIAVT